MSSLVSRMQPEYTKLPPEIYWRRKWESQHWRGGIGERCATVLKQNRSQAVGEGPTPSGARIEGLGGQWS